MNTHMNKSQTLPLSHGFVQAATGSFIRVSLYSCHSVLTPAFPEQHRTFLGARWGWVSGWWAGSRLQLCAMDAPSCMPSYGLPSPAWRGSGIYPYTGYVTLGRHHPRSSAALNTDLW